MLRDAIMVAIGVGIGWIVFKQPQWATDAWQWIKHKIHPATPPTPTPKV